jgi:P27 family predicted phage terminase small subunit
MTNPDAWDRSKFVAETSEFLFTVYGIGNDQDKHTLAMLADQIDIYVKCSKGIAKNGVVTTYNEGKTIGANPYIAVRNKALTLIIQLMNELGLTPRSRLAAGKVESESIATKFLTSPFKQ